MKSFDSIPNAVKAIRRGKIVIVVDSKDRENEGDFVLAAQKATAQKLNFLVSRGKGLLCVPITSAKALQLDLPMMTPDATDSFQTPFTISVDAANGKSGISVPNRLEGLRILASDSATPRDLVRPGHLFPLVARDGGVLERAGHTEASVDLLKLAGLKPVGVICEILNEKGKTARLSELIRLKKKFKLKMVSIADLIAHRLKQGSTVHAVVQTPLHTEFGDFSAVGFFESTHRHEYFALVKGNVQNKKNVLVRVHSACLTGDVFHSLHCDCHAQLISALRAIQKEKRGVLLYIPHHEGRGIGLLNKLKSYQWQERGKDTIEANHALGLPMDKRDFGIGAQILRLLGLSTIRILTNNPKKLVGLSAFGLRITKQIPITAKPNKHNARYLKTKKEKMNHLL